MTGKKDSIETYHSFAKSRGGICLSKEYKGSASHLVFQCDKGHVWKATPNSVKSRASWCRLCANESKKDSLETFRKIAEKRGGKCLSEVYVHSKEHLIFRCANGHVFSASPLNVKHNDSWCPQCKLDSFRSGLFECQELAKERRGECLSTTYVNQHTLMSWRCANGHEWESRYLDIKKNKSWCPTCASGYGERITRHYFSQLFGYDFPKSRPKWLKNKDGNRMELDGYCRSLGLAFEHQGEHHYSEKPHYSDRVKLKKRRRDDETKRSLCKKNDVVLIEVPEVPRLLTVERLKQHIKDALAKEGTPKSLSKLAKTFDRKRVDHIEAYSPESLKTLRLIAAKNNGKLISRSYLGIFEKLEFECQHGHRFLKAPTKIIHRGQWCPKCSLQTQRDRGKKLRKPVSRLRQLAEQHDGQLLSEKSLGSHRKHLWTCRFGHEFAATPANVLKGRWCPVCAKSKIRERHKHRFEEMVAGRGGQIINGEYHHSREKVTLRCMVGHTWEVMPVSIRSGSWCPTCARMKSKKSAGGTLSAD